MAIFNTGNGGSTLQYTVKVQKDRPTVTGSKKIIWIKDDLTFLNPYDNEKNEKLNIMTPVIAYKGSTQEIDKNKCNATFVHTSIEDSAFIHLDQSMYKTNTIFRFQLNSSYPLVNIIIPKNTGNNEGLTKIKIGFAQDELSEGLIVSDIIEKTFKYSSSAQNIELTKDDITNTRTGFLYTYMYVIYDLESYKASTYNVLTAKGYDENRKKSTSLNSKSDRGTFVNNCIIADPTNNFTTVYFEANSNKGYRLYPNNNLYYLFNTKKIPNEGETGTILSNATDGVYYNRDENYYLIDGSKCNYICYTYDTTLENIPYVIDGTYTLDFQKKAGGKNTLTSLYSQDQGYTISSFMPTRLENENIELKNANERYFWIVSGNNKNINFNITKSNKKQNYISLEGVVARLPYVENDRIAHSILYFLKAEFWDGKNWIPLKNSSNQLFNLEALIEGDLEEIYYDENESLRPYAFYKYSNLKSIDFPNCEILGENAFTDCVNLSTVNLPKWEKYLAATTDNNNYVDTNYFYSNKVVYSPFKGCSNIVKANIGLSKFIDGTYNKQIINCASPFFMASEKLKELTISNCSYIGNYTFYSHKKLEKVVLGNDLSNIEIKDNAFAFCDNLSNIINNSQISFIGANAFQQCTNLKNLNLLKATQINNNAFSSCINLVEILNEEDVKANGAVLKTIGQNAFYNTSISTLYAPNCISFGTSTVKGYNIASTPINMCKNLQSLTLGWGSNFGKTAIPALFQGANFPLLSYVSLSQVSSIATNAFLKASNLSTVFLSTRLSTLPDLAFDTCKNTVETYFPKIESGFPIHEFKYDLQTDETGQIIYEKQPIGQDYPCKIKYQLSGTDIKGENIYEPITDDNGNYIYVETENPDDKWMYEIISYTYYNNSTEADMADDYYLPEYNYNKPIYNMDAPKTDYSKIQYEPFILGDFNEENKTEDGNSRKKIEGNKISIYTKNVRLIMGEDDQYNEKYDDFIYSYIDDGQNISSLEKTKMCYFLFDKNDDGTIKYHQAKESDEEKVLSEKSHIVVALSENKEDSTKYWYKQKIGKTNLDTHEIAVTNDQNINYLYSQADNNSNIQQNNHILLHTDNYFYKQKIDNPSEHEVIIPEENINYVYAQLTGETGNHQVAINGYLYEQKTDNVDIYNNEVAVPTEINGEIINYIYSGHYDENNDLVADMTQPIADLNKPIANQASPIIDLKSPVADMDRPIADKNQPVYNLTKPKLKKAVYDTKEAYDRIINEEDGSPIVDSDKQIQYNKTEVTTGIEYVNKYSGKPGRQWNFSTGIIAQGLKSIGKQCFRSCANLKEVYLCDYLSSSATAQGTLGVQAFMNCESLQIVDAPYVSSMISATNKTNWPFVGCGNLVSLNLSNFSISAFGAVLFNSGDASLYPALEDVKLNKVTTLNPSTFKNTNLKVGTFNSCTTINANAFYGTQIGYITTSGDEFYGPNKISGYSQIGNTETYFYRDIWTIKDSEFKSFINENPEAREAYNNIVTLSAFTLNRSHMYNGSKPITTYNGIFSQCQKLKGGYLGDKITVIPKETFANCISIEKISQETTIESNQYDCLYIPSVSILGEGAFRDCGAVQNLIVSGSQSTIYTGLSQISFGDALTEIHSSAFQNCHNLQTIIFNKNTSNSISIGNNAFNNCINLTKVKDIPAKLSYIGENAFTNPDNSRNGTLELYFTNFSVEDTVPSIATNAFPLGKLMIYFSSNDIKNKFITATNWNSYSSFMYVLSNFSIEN